jgi:hypothetical protein
MPRNASGKKRGRKSYLSPEQIAFLESFGDRFRAGAGNNNALYSEVLDKWLDTFAYAGLSSSGTIAVSELRLDEDLSTLTEEQRDKVLTLREAAKQAIRSVSFF